MKDDFERPPKTIPSTQNNLNDDLSLTIKPKGRYHRYIYPDFQASDKQIVDQASPYFIALIEKESWSTFQNIGAGDQTPERPSTPESDFCSLSFSGFASSFPTSGLEENDKNDAMSVKGISIPTDSVGINT